MTASLAPFQITLTPYASESGALCQKSKEYYNKHAQLCCAACPPGQHVKHLCTKAADTVCADCETGTYTQLWNSLSKCLSCGSRCDRDQVVTRNCTKQQNLVCTCKANMYCALPGKADSCRQCMRLSKCGPGFGVANARAANENVVCRACAPGTFSDTTSSTDMCKPHRRCNILAIPGNASADAVCAPESPALSTVPRAVSISQPEPTRSQPQEPESERSQTPPTVSLFETKVTPPKSLIIGVTALSLLMLGLVNCFILVQKKKKPSCLQREAKVLHLPDENSQGATGLEQQHLLTTAPSSSRSSLESSASTGDRRAAPRSQPQATASEEAQGTQETCAGSRSSGNLDAQRGQAGKWGTVPDICSVNGISVRISQCRDKLLVYGLGCGEGHGVMDKEEINCVQSGEDR
ncbi:hypothetical protein U0070_016082 [Myodes glareolus]|uniref:TNFR-Cys domain-containing protein n=1 Tax=Myodes glareolus TaxID=447135 RepID=A0AAW0I9T7_MYOGA